MKAQFGCSRCISMRAYFFFILLAVVLAAVLSVFSVVSRKPAPDESYLTQTRILLGTEVTIKAQASAEDMKQAFEAVRKIDEGMNHYDPESEISRLNVAGSKEVSPELREVVEHSLHYSRITEGAFDITVQPLVLFWHQMGKERRMPAPEELIKIRAVVGFEKMRIDDRRILLEEGMGLDVGGIAKGYAVDKAIEVLRERGVKNALVDAGGDLYCMGKGPHGTWKVGIQHPRKMDELVEVLGLSGRGVATSGDYRRFHMIFGRRFGHIIDPATGWTVQDNPMSVTIIASDATMADALATGVFVLGSERGMQLIERLPEVEGMIIDENMRIFKSSNWEQFTVYSSN